jgi:putative tryptophan/tyrosine transport system substrate-binding protein
MSWQRALSVIAAMLSPFTSPARGELLVHRIGVLSSSQIPENIRVWEESLRDHGYVVGSNLQIEYRFFQGRTERIPALLAELVSFDPEVIVTSTSDSAAAIHSAAPTIPMVFLTVADPIGLGLVKSLAHPGGNVTGFATTSPEGFISKHLQVLQAAVPGVKQIAVLFNPAIAMHQLGLQKLPQAERLLGVGLVAVEASKPDQFETAFEAAQKQGAEAIDVWNGPMIFTNSARIVGLAAHYQLPEIYWDRGYVVGGGLMSYGPSTTDMWRGAAGYVDKILKGENPGDLPVQQPTRYYLTVNLKTAKERGITIPPDILVQADEVIE